MSERLRADGWDLVDEELFDAEPEDLELTSVEQLQTLTHALRMRLLTSIARRPASAKELASRFDVPTTRLYHHLDLLEEQGLVQVVATRRSGARTERCYGMMPPRHNIHLGKAVSVAQNRSVLAEALSSLVEIAGLGLAEAVRSGAADVFDEGDKRTVVSSMSALLTADEQRRFAREFEEVTERMIEVARANRAAVESGEEVDAEPVQLLVIQSPDVLQPE